MNNATKLFKNAIYSSMAEILGPLISIFLIIYTSRKLGTSGLGEYNTVIIFHLFFEKFAQLGLHDQITRDMASDPSRGESYLNASLLIGVFSSLVVLPFLYIVLAAMHYPEPISQGVKVLSLSLVFFVLTDYQIAFFEGFQRMELKTAVSLVEAISRVSLGILAVYLGYGVLGLLWAVVTSRVLVTMLTSCIVIKLGIKPTWKLDRPLCRKLLKETGTFLMISLVTTAYWKIDVVILSKMKGAAEVGLYSAAFRLMDILKGLSYSYTAALFPMMASVFAVSKQSLKQQCTLSVRYLFMMTFPISIGISILAGNIITLIYGKQFSGSISILQVLIWTICFFPIALVFARVLVASRNQKLDLLSNIFVMVFNSALNFILIPHLSSLGAAIATLLSICFFMSLQYYFVYKSLFKISFIKDLFKPFVAGCIMGILTYSLRDVNLVFVVAASAILYIATLLLLKTFSDEEVKRFRAIWDNRALIVTLHG